MQGLREASGVALGSLLAPWFAAVSFGRRGRALHPEGIVVLADVETHRAAHGEERELASRLAGPALVRLSGALWRGSFEHLDVLGIALRFRGAGEVTADAARGDQDLLFATILSPLTMGLALFTTDPHDFLANTYYAVAPFSAGGWRHMKLRLVPTPIGAPPGDSRAGRLRRALSERQAAFRLDRRLTFHPSWRPVVTIRLRAEVPIDQEALVFSPFRNGRGLVPRGLVHALRRVAYPASQWARAAASGDRGGPRREPHPLRVR